MGSTLDSEIREQLACYLAGQTSLRGFHEWLAPRAWVADESENPEATELADEIELRLAEFTSGHWSEAELKELLQPLVERHKASA